ncbi:hypothetical protein Cgig2_033868 [Carnegiea gigantea]|uniref:Uncharacterized protein n=1 Tax=Carnegiea gigantea TaxID=171969 RepID=A0A9Q1JXG4_9CARY|nr:hypothetical protein Cgig2_033868 [Carnegiea gigantea]
MAIEGDADRRIFFKGNEEHNYLYVGGNGRLTRQGYKAGATCEGHTLSCDHSVAGAANGGNGGLKGNNKEIGVKRACATERGEYVVIHTIVLLLTTLKEAMCTDRQESMRWYTGAPTLSSPASRLTFILICTPPPSTPSSTLPFSCTFSNTLPPTHLLPQSPLPSSNGGQLSRYFQQRLHSNRDVEEYIRLWRALERD